MLTNNKRIRVALVCHFSNAKVREHLPLDNRAFYTTLRKIFRLPTKESGYGDVAAWDTYMIEMLRKRDDIDLYVIAAHPGLKKNICSFELEGVHYNFLSYEVATMLKHIIPSPALWHKLNPMRPKVRRLVREIKPDIIALIGAENPHIAGTVIGIKGIPIVVKCQTIYNSSIYTSRSNYDKKNAYVERKIFEGLRYVSVTTEMHERLFRVMNPTAYNFNWNLGNLLPEVVPVEKEFDFVNFAMAMCDVKGYPDAIEALDIVKERYPNVRLNLIGGGYEEYKSELQNKVKSLGLEKNVVFTPFFERQEDLFQHIQKARFALLPCKLDYVSSTQRQAMHYQLPVVCYKTEGTITLNQEKNCVLLVENSDVKDLASKMLLLLDDNKKANELRDNAKEYSTRFCDDEINTNQMVDNFYAIIDNYRNGTPIPEHLLFKVTV